MLEVIFEQLLVNMVFFLFQIITTQTTFPLVSFVPPGSLQGEHQRRLYKELMANYNRLERPVVNDSAAILVELGLTLLQIIDVVRTTAFVGIINMCVCVSNWGQKPCPQLAKHLFLGQWLWLG